MAADENPDMIVMQEEIGVSFIDHRRPVTNYVSTGEEDVISSNPDVSCFKTSGNSGAEEPRTCRVKVTTSNYAFHVANKHGRHRKIQQSRRSCTD